MVRVRLLGSSMVPLIAILAIRLWPENRPFALVLLMVVAISVASLALFFNARTGVARQNYVVESVQDESDQVPAYLLTYLFPFLSLDTKHWQDLIAFAVFAALLALLVVQTNLIVVQPLLLMFGIHTYRTFLRGSANEVLVMTRLRLAHGRHITTFTLAGPTIYATRFTEDKS